MPQRTPQHRLEPRSRRCFEEALGDRFVFREETEDYGIDLTVEEFEGRGGQMATGLRFHVQLKATAEPDLSKSLRLSLSLDKARYYRSLTLPVLMVRYRAADETLYARWFHQSDADYDGMGKKTMTFHWKAGDRFDETTPARLVEQARAFLTLRRDATLLTPMDLYLDVESGGAYGLEPTPLLFALRNAAELRSDIVWIKSGHPPPGTMRVIARKELLAVNLSEVTTATVDLEGYDAGELGEQFGVDAMVMVALAFEQVGRSDIASRLTTGYIERSTLAGSPEIAWGLSWAMARARRVREAIRLADALDASEDAELREASLPFLLVPIWHGRWLDGDELKDLGRTIETRIARRHAAGNEVEAGRESYNLAEVLRRRGETEKALASYDHAVRYDPGYEKRPYFHEERAGLLFLTQQYRAAADAYERAQQLGAGDSSIIALRADALMFSGCYEEARTGFAQYNAAVGQEGQAEWRLKEFFLGSILIDRLALRAQDRDPERAGRAADAVDVGSPPTSEMMRALESILQIDALCGLGLFKLGLVSQKAGNVSAAILGYLGAALCWRRAAGPWVLATMLAVEEPAAHVIADDILICGAILTGADFRSELISWTKQLQAENPNYPAEEVLSIIEGRLRDLKPDATDGMLIRHLDRQGNIQEMLLGGRDSE